MYKDARILCIIPARVGSKGLPGKNIRPLLGKPLLAWTVEQAQASQYIDTIFVSTDDEGIADVARQYGVDIPFLRPAEFARDDSPTMDVIAHTVDFFRSRQQEFDLLVLLEPTSPLRKKGDVDAAIAQFWDAKDSVDALVSVGEIHLEHPYASKEIINGQVRALVEPPEAITRRQQLPKAYFPYGVIYASKTVELLCAGTFYQKRTLPYVIERWQNYEIDDIYDFLCIETLLKDKLKEIQ